MGGRNWAAGGERYRLRREGDKLVVSVEDETRRGGVCNGEPSTALVLGALCGCGVYGRRAYIFQDARILVLGHLQGLREHAVRG